MNLHSMAKWYTAMTCKYSLVLYHGKDKGKGKGTLFTLGNRI